MRIHYLQHVPFEGLGSIDEWLKRSGHQLSSTPLFSDVTFPNPDSFELLIVMGGPMGIYDYAEYPWLKDEKLFLQSTISAGKAVLGICLGAQLIADALGAVVVKNVEKEIGWFPLTIQEDCPKSFHDIIPQEQPVFHWHGDTFALPVKSIGLWGSVGCENQGFLYGDRVVGLQFHLETTPESCKLLIQNCRDEIVPGKWIQTEKEMLSRSSHFSGINNCMERILNYLEDIVTASVYPSR